MPASGEQTTPALVSSQEKAGQSSEREELATAIRSLTESIQASNREIARLASVIEVVVGRLAAQSASSAGKRGRVNWVIGPAENVGWAYGNNARRLAGKLEDYAHAISGTEPSDIAVYFDPLIAQRYPVDARKTVLRIGGPRPLTRVSGDDDDVLRSFLQPFDAIVVLNSELLQRLLPLHPNVHLIPNALDLSAWPEARTRRGTEFVAGFAASLNSTAEAETKGWHIARAAAERAGVELLMASRGKDQIPHEHMHEDFYSRIDVLIHPVGPGREGTSNVIMEALAAGVPVVTTRHSGFHGEFLCDGRNALIRERDIEEFAEALRLVEQDHDLRRRLSREGRAFAERHHDLGRASQLYARLFHDLVSPKEHAPQVKRVSFVPYWEPAERFGSSRLRAKYPSELLAETQGLEIALGYSADADVAVIVQMCSDQVLAEIRENPQQFVIYDVCDKYYENPRVFRHVDPPVSSLERFQELVERADLLTVPSRELKVEIASRYPGKAVKYVPEPVDYGESASVLVPRERRTKKVLWFGNPDRGNFSSARWMIEHLRDRHGYTPLIVSRERFFRELPELHPYVRDWSPEAMDQAFREVDLCVLACSPEETAKSANRFVSATMHGIPTLILDEWPACAEILAATKQDFARVRDTADLDRAVVELDAPTFREKYVSELQRYITQVHGPAAIRATYAELFSSSVFPRREFARRRRVAFVSHNLALGEGAPWSLFELAHGLSSRGVEPFVFASGTGPLLEEYRRAGLDVEVFDLVSRHAVSALNGHFEALRQTFLDFLSRNRVEAVVCNTVKSAPFAAFAREAGIPASLIVRESYGPEERFSHFVGDARLSATEGLLHASQVVFVANSSREHWLDQPFKGRVRVIPNGISPARFASLEGMTKLEARRALGLPEDGIIAVCVGTVTLRKGQRELLAAYADLPAFVRARTHLVFVGATDGKQSQELREAWRSLPAAVREHVLIREATRDAGPYYKASDLFLMNSKSEAYPRSVVEALYFGLPVLSTPVFGVREQIEHGRSGYLYEHDDWASWRAHFSRLVLDDTLRERTSVQARRAFWKLTGHEEMLVAYKAMLAAMLQEEGPKPLVQEVRLGARVSRAARHHQNGEATSSRVIAPPAPQRPAWKRKLSKLRRDPKAFLLDSHAPGLRLIARVVLRPPVDAYANGSAQNSSIGGASSPERMYRVSKITPRKAPPAAWKRKLAKLKREPRAFIVDSRLPALRFVAKALRLESED